MSPSYEQWQEKRLNANYPGWTVTVTVNEAVAERPGQRLSASNGTVLRVMLDQILADDAYRSVNSRRGF